MKSVKSIKPVTAIKSIKTIKLVKEGVYGVISAPATFSNVGGKERRFCAKCRFLLPTEGRLL